MEKINFNKISEDTVAEANQRNQFESNFFTLPYDKNVLIRVLPPFDGSGGRPYYKVAVHFGFVGKDGKNRVYVCSLDKFGTCPICDRVRALKSESDKLIATKTQEGFAQSKVYNDQIQSIRRVKQYLYNILDPNGKESILVAKPSQHDAIIGEIQDQMEHANINLTDYNTGGLLRLKRTKVKPWCTARVEINAENGGVSFPLKPETIQNLKLRKLDEVYIQNTPDELARVIQGEDVNAEKLEQKKKEFVTKSAAPNIVTPTPVTVTPTPAITPPTVQQQVNTPTVTPAVPSNQLSTTPVVSNNTSNVELDSNGGVPQSEIDAMKAMLAKC